MNYLKKFESYSGKFKSLISPNDNELIDSIFCDINDLFLDLYDARFDLSFLKISGNYEKSQEVKIDELMLSDFYDKNDNKLYKSISIRIRKKDRNGRVFLSCDNQFGFNMDKDINDFVSRLQEYSGGLKIKAYDRGVPRARFSNSYYHGDNINLYDSLKYNGELRAIDIQVRINI